MQIFAKSEKCSSGRVAFLCFACGFAYFLVVLFPAFSWNVCWFSRAMSGFLGASLFALGESTILLSDLFISFLDI